jgi:hypothetical protein
MLKDDMVKELTDKYIKGDVSDIARMWDKERSHIIAMTLTALLPVFQKELHAKLLADARAVALRK